MNDEYYKNSAEDKATTEGTTKIWLRKTLFNPIFIIICIIIIANIFIIYWRYIRPQWYKKIHKKLLQVEGFKYSHLTNQGEASQQQGEALTQPVGNTNCHMLIYGSSESGKTSFLKYYLLQTAELRTKLHESDYSVFGRDEEEFPASNFVPLLQLEK